MTRAPKLYRLPVRFVDGAFELEFGGALPLEDGTKGELIVNEHKITDGALLKALRSKKTIKILDKGSKLVVMLSNSRPELVSDPLRKALLSEDFERLHLGKWWERWDHAPSRRNFIEIEIGAANERQMKFPDIADGGLWLHVQGWQATGLESSEIILPDCVPGGPAISLNHAYTLLSEAFEPWRISHTGNIYEQILYREGNGKWYPLEFLREEKELEEGQTIAAAHWKRFLVTMRSAKAGH